MDGIRGLKDCKIKYSVFGEYSILIQPQKGAKFTKNKINM